MVSPFNFTRMFKVRIAHTEEELQGILQLRYEVLRKPWGQPAATATDERESDSINAYISEHDKVIACARLQDNGNGMGQIRFMAVDPAYQGKGLGKIIVKSLEEEALKLNIEHIELQARENAVKFYESCGYSIKEKTFLLWGIIQHYLMIRDLRN